MIYSFIVSNYLIYDLRNKHPFHNLFKNIYLKSIYLLLIIFNVIQILESPYIFLMYTYRPLMNRPLMNRTKWIFLRIILIKDFILTKYLILTNKIIKQKLYFISNIYNLISTKILISSSAFFSIYMSILILFIFIVIRINTFNSWEYDSTLFPKPEYTFLSLSTPAEIARIDDRMTFFSLVRNEEILSEYGKSIFTPQCLKEINCLSEKKYIFFTIINTKILLNNFRMDSIRIFLFYDAFSSLKKKDFFYEFSFSYSNTLPRMKVSTYLKLLFFYNPVIGCARKAIFLQQFNDELLKFLLIKFEGKIPFKHLDLNWKYKNTVFRKDTKNAKNLRYIFRSIKSSAYPIYINVLDVIYFLVPIDLEKCKSFSIFNELLVVSKQNYLDLCSDHFNLILNFKGLDMCDFRSDWYNNRIVVECEFPERNDSFFNFYKRIHFNVELNFLIFLFILIIFLHILFLV